MLPSVRYEIQFVGGMSNAFFGGEGLFLASLVGRGQSGCNRCRFLGWLGVWPVRCRELAEAAKARVRCQAGSATC